MGQTGKTALPWDIGEEWGRLRRLGEGSGLESWGVVGSTDLGRNERAWNSRGRGSSLGQG